MSADLKTGIELVTKATEQDSKGQIREAINLYEISLEYFQKALKIETNEQTKTLINQKMTEYSNRLQKLKSTTSSSAAPKTEQSTAPTTREIVSAPPSIDWTSLQQAQKKKWTEYENNDSDMRALLTDLEQAMKSVEEATQEEIAGNYEKALTQYQLALDHFMKAMEVEKNPDIRDAIKLKVSQYMTRAELIKDAIKLQKAKSSGSLKLKPKLEHKTSIGSVERKQASQKIEVSQEASQFVEQAIQSATQAVADDEAGKLEEAAMNYSKAIEFFSQALKVEGNPGVRSMIKEKLVSYNTRLEQLRNIKSIGSVVPTPIQFGLSKPGEKYKAPETKKHKKGKKTWDKF